MGNIFAQQQKNQQPIKSGSRLNKSIAVKNMPMSSFAYQVTPPEINRNVQIVLRNPNFNKYLNQSVQDKAFFYIPSKRVFYQGQFNSNRLPQGLGNAIFQDGTYYHGNFMDGIAQDAEGILVFPNGAHFHGHVRNSTINGKGKFQHQDYCYDGQWKDGVPYDHNATQEYGTHKNRYTGQFSQGFKDGVGTYVWDDGASKYQGQFLKGLMHDKNGLIQTKEGLKYRGQFRSGKRQGLGAIQTNNGVLEGKFINDQINEKGTFRWKDGKIYRGDFLNSQFHGKGEIVYPNGRVAKGQWQNNHNKHITSVENQ